MPAARLQHPAGSVPRNRKLRLFFRFFGGLSSPDSVVKCAAGTRSTRARHAPLTPPTARPCTAPSQAQVWRRAAPHLLPLAARGGAGGGRPVLRRPGVPRGGGGAPLLAARQPHRPGAPGWGAERGFGGEHMRGTSPSRLQRGRPGQGGQGSGAAASLVTAEAMTSATAGMHVGSRSAEWKKLC